MAGVLADSARVCAFVPGRVLVVDGVVVSVLGDPQPVVSDAANEVAIGGADVDERLHAGLLVHVVAPVFHPRLVAALVEFRVARSFPVQAQDRLSNVSLNILEKVVSFFLVVS